MTSEAVDLDHDDYHVYTLDFNQNGLHTKVDGRTILSINHNYPEGGKSKFMTGGYWEEGKFQAGLNNPWKGRRAAPFDQEFYIIINLAVGGTNGYFPENIGNKPWKNNNDPFQSMKDFWDSRDQWLPTWKNNSDRALVIDYVKIWDLC